MKECQAKVSRILEQEMQAKKEQHDARRKENEKRKESLAQSLVYSPPRGGSSVARQVEKIIAPLAEDVRRLKELSEKNKRALDAVDPARDTGRSAASARAGTQPNAKLWPEHRREAPPARHTDPYHERNLRVEVREQPSPGHHLSPPSAAAAPADARENGSDAGQRRRRKRKRRERSREDA
jgi:hypothetical protein